MPTMVRKIAKESNSDTACLRQDALQRPSWFSWGRQSVGGVSKRRRETLGRLSISIYKCVPNTLCSNITITWLFPICFQCKVLNNGPHSVFLPGPEKYDFNLYKGFSVEKMTQIRQILKFFFSRPPRPPSQFVRFLWSVPVGSQENRGFRFFFHFHL